MSEDVTLKIKQMIAERINRSLDEITDDARFIEDLGADSLDITELLMMLEEEFQIEIDEDSSQISTVGDAVSYISSRL
ncbi:MAG: acyl carrier protein [Candidatus Hydrogenedens sp.]|jgi:acyl carrier protein|nr:acyl carrier protein [Candidatus Hydrogenedens sp.]